VDPFLGSGTTAVACEETGRRWVGIEYEEAHCQTTITRLQAFRHLDFASAE
ncbi:MAG: site-specific DNA-methyltransferase, partial [Synergistaceae bacterium]|nr:site-specific DNA-methyltransferase [Synergistaceae bacterium]